VSYLSSSSVRLSSTMATDYIRYDILAKRLAWGRAPRYCGRRKKGLPGEHHFKSRSTVAPGVRLSERMRGKYPDAMTIVLQHQFWDLTVDDDGFESACRSAAFRTARGAVRRG